MLSYLSSLVNMPICGKQKVIKTSLLNEMDRKHEPRDLA